MFGHVYVYSIRVYRGGQITEAFRKWFEMQERLADYPVLDEEDYSQREYDATVANIADAAWRLKHEYKLPEEWATEVYQWFTDYDHAAVDNRDDSGGYPTEDQLKAAFAALGYANE